MNEMITTVDKNGLVLKIEWRPIEPQNYRYAKEEKSSVRDLMRKGAITR